MKTTHTTTRPSYTGIGNQRGVSILSVLLLLTILTLMGTIAIKKATVDIKTSGHFKNSTKVLYVAEAGIEQAKSVLSQMSLNNALDGEDNQKGNEQADEDNGILSFGSAVSFGGGDYCVKVSDNDDGDGDIWTDTDGRVTISSTPIFAE
jgi:hypothetical protein